MAKAEKLQELAAELGFQIKKLPKRGSGYLLVNKSHDDIDEFPLGDNFSASLADVEDYLESYAADIAAGRVKPSDNDDEPEVETSADVPKVKLPSRQKLAAALRGHADAKEIKAMTKSANVDLKPTITLHDLNLEVRALKSRDEFNPNWNDVGGHNVNENDEADGGHALREYRESVERENRNLIPPDKGTPDFTAPKAATTFVVTSKKCRVKKADISPKARTLLTIEIAIRAAQLKGDKAGIGKLLLEAKASTIDHGDFMQWAERATGLTSRSCRNYMATADQNGK